MKKKHLTILFILIICLSSLILVGTITDDHGWGDDHAGYIMQAQSIVEGTPRAYLESNRFAIEQSSEAFGPTAYPWGYPLLLAPIYAIFGLNFLALKSIAIISYLLFLISLWFVFRENHSPLWFLILISLFAFNPRMLDFSNNISSDLSFLFVSTVGIWTIQEIVVHEKQVFNRYVDPFLIGIIITISFLLRTNGILLVVTLALSQVIALYRKKLNKQKSETKRSNGSASEILASPEYASKQRLLAKFIPYLVFIFSVVIWKFFLPEGGTSHFSFLTTITIQSVIDSVPHYIGTSADFFEGIRFPYLFIGASFPLAIAGAVRRYRLDYPAIIYCILTVVLYMIWPYWQRLRFFFPILPFYISFVLTSLESFSVGSTRFDNALRKAFSFLPVLILVIGFLYANLRVVINRNLGDGVKATGPSTEMAQDMFSYIEKHTEPDSIIVFIKPRLMSLLTDRQSIKILTTDQLSRGNYLSFYRKNDHHKLSQIPDQELEVLLEQGALLEVFKNQEFIIYRLNME